MLIFASRLDRLTFDVLLGLYAVGMFFLTLPPVQPPNRFVAIVLLVDMAAYLIDYRTGGKIQGWVAGLVGRDIGVDRGWRRR